MTYNEIHQNFSNSAVDIPFASIAVMQCSEQILQLSLLPWVEKERCGGKITFFLGTRGGKDGARIRRQLGGIANLILPPQNGEPYP